MNHYIDTRLNYDSCSYKEQLKRSVGPGLYQLETPYNDCKECFQDVPNDPALIYQNYGQNTCSMKKAVDDSSELLGLNYKKTYSIKNLLKKRSCCTRNNKMIIGFDLMAN